MGLLVLADALAIALALALLPGRASAHGYLSVPPSRNLLAHRAGLEWDPHSLNGGGPWSVWPSGRWQPGGGGLHPVCGRDAYAAPGPVQALWTEGQLVRLQVVVTAPHAGHFFFGICPAGQESAACFNAHPLTDAETGLPYWSLGGRGGARYGATGPHDMTFRLPAGVKCARCTLRFYWLTGNSCDPPGAAPTGMGTCGGSGALPEEFWNCSDVVVLPRPPQVPSPKPSRKPRPKHSSPKPKKPSPTPRPAPKSRNPKSPKPNPKATGPR